jgi:hypothetical protein
MSTIEVQREDAGVTDILRYYEVLVDEVTVGLLGPGQSVVVEVSPGDHEIYLKISWARSPKVDLKLMPGETARFGCEPRANLITDLYWATIGRQRYIKLFRITD